MSTFLLIHGAWHGGWCWEKVVPLLEERGHEVVVADLPGHGDNHVPVPEVTLAAYGDHIAGVLDGQTEPVVLVGHSMGGLVISEAAERRPEKIGLLVYLTGFLLPNGGTLFEMAQTDGESIVFPNADVDEENGVVKIHEDRAKDVFYGDCSDEDVEKAKERLIPQPLAPFVTPVGVGEAFGRVRRTYIECLQDRAIGPATQKRMYTGLPCEKVVSMGTSHSPFLSEPEELAGHLDSLARL
ncbi:MAG: alpha/beta fold hydrolase [Rubrobacter sp.]